MKEVLQNTENNPEKSQSTIGLRLQDVFTLITYDPILNGIRKKLEFNQKNNPDINKRIQVLDEVCLHILNINLDQALFECSTTLVPYRRDGNNRKFIIISSASTSSASQETEKGILNDRGHVIDIPGAIEGRDTISANPGDISIISTKAGLTMARTRSDLTLIDLTDQPLINTDKKVITVSDIYYKSDALLLLILLNPQSEILNRILLEFSNQPVVNPYNLDEETQLVLLWIAKKAGLPHIEVNANSPNVAVELTKKSYKYPTIEEALDIMYDPSPIQMQTTEWERSQAFSEIKYHSDYIPGYALLGSDNFHGMSKTLIACMLLATRYGLDTGWIKPDRGTDGGNQYPFFIGINPEKVQNILELLNNRLIHKALEIYSSELPDIDQTMNHIDSIWQTNSSWVVEAKTNYFPIIFKYPLGEKIIMTAPSVHVLKGQPRRTVALQIVDDKAWGGNLICSQNTWNKLIEMIDPNDPRLKNNPALIDELLNCYPLMIHSIENLVTAVNNSEKYKNGQVRGGVDLAICTLGGKYHHEHVIVGLQDNNARANGCETAYSLYDQAQKVYGAQGEAVTRNVVPLVNFNTFLSALSLANQEVNQMFGTNVFDEQIRLIAISAGWGQIGMIGNDALEILQNIFLLENQLRLMHLIR
jgi:hypothetical protein